MNAFLKNIAWWHVMRDVAVLYALVLFGVSSMLIAAMFAHDRYSANAVVFANRIALAAGFTLAGSLGKRSRIPRLKHLAVVAACYYIIFVLGGNLLFQRPIIPMAFFISLRDIILFAFVGAGVSFFVARPWDEIISERNPEEVSNGSADSESNSLADSGVKRTIGAIDN